MGLAGAGLEPQSTDQGSQGPSDGPDFKLRVYCSRPPSGRPRSTWVSPCCGRGGSSQKRGAGCRRGRDTGMACSRQDMAPSGGLG